MVVTRLVNVRYLTGFTGSNAALLVTADDAVLATDGRYITQAEQQAPDLERVIDRQCATALVARARKDGVDRLAFEAHHVTVDLHETLRSTGEGVELIASGQLVEQLRSVKDDDEIALLWQACAISDRALTELFATIAPGRTEREIARDLENRMLDHGATGVAFETIVATGPNSAVPHHRPTDRAVAAGDLLKIDSVRSTRATTPTARARSWWGPSRPTGSARSTAWCVLPSGPAGTRSHRVSTCGRWTWRRAR